MKHLILLSLLTLHFSLFILSASAGIPLKWTVETSRAVPAQFEAYQGETLALEASLKSDGKPLEAPSNYSLYWQTNGMGSAYWSTNISNVSNLSNPSNILRATWTPSMETGAKVYNCFIGQPGTIYHAAFQLRLRPSPGALPNELPLPQKVIDFAKVTVLNPPWSGGGGGGVDTNAVIDIIHKTVDGSARYTPKYLWVYDCSDSYPDEAEEYYRSRGDGKTDGGCSSVRSGGFLSRNFDYPFDERAEFVVKMSAGPNRFASVGVSQVGTNLTEAIVTSGKPSRCYKWLPGATVDGINENGVVCNINVVGGDPQTNGWHTTGDLHPLAAVRWVLDHATNAQHAATYIAANIRFPSGWTQNFHYMVADAEKTYIVENGTATDGDEYHEPDEPVTMTNFQLSKFPWGGMGMERFGLLLGGANITNAWYTRCYRRETNPPWVTDLADVLAYTNEIFDAWATHPKEYFRNSSLIPHTSSLTWWQTVHTSIYDLKNLTLRIAVQETDDWYTFAVPSAGGVKPEAVREIVEPMICAATNGLRRVDDMAVYTNAFTEWVASIPVDGYRPSYGDYEGTVPAWYIVKDDVYYSVPNRKSPDETVLHWSGADWAELIDITFTRSKFLVQSVDRLATTNGVNAAIEAHHDETKATLPLQYGPDYVVYIDSDGVLRETDYSHGDVARFWGGKLVTTDGDVTADMIANGASKTELAGKQDALPYPTNAIPYSAITGAPTAVRTYDRVRHCWWVLEMVNGVPTWTVED